MKKVMAAMWVKQKKLSDKEIILGLQKHNPIVEKYFFDMTYRYFDCHFNQFFFDADSKQEVFQAAIIKLWTEIENKKINVIGNGVCRRQKSGEYCEMSASLCTFMMAFAKNEFRELLRNLNDDNYEDITNSSICSMEVLEDTSNNSDYTIQIVDECVLSLSPNCIEIITMFYYQKKSLDEIMESRGEQNTSKDGLKAAKNKCMVTLRKRVTEELNRIGYGNY